MLSPAFSKDDLDSKIAPFRSYFFKGLTCLELAFFSSNYSDSSAKIASTGIGSQMRRESYSQKAKKPRLQSELFLASDPRSGMDAALSQILTKIKSPAMPNDS